MNLTGDYLLLDQQGDVVVVFFWGLMYSAYSVYLRLEPQELDLMYSVHCSIQQMVQHFRGRFYTSIE